MQKIKIYCAFVGTGKTYFCQHHLGGVDIDEAASVKAGLPSRFLSLVYQCYHNAGYRIITNATPYVFQALMEDLEKYEIIIILPPKEMKEELLQRVYDRGDIEWYPYLCNVYDGVYKHTVDFPIIGKKVGLKPGQYVEDIIKEMEQENLDQI